MILLPPEENDDDDEFTTKVFTNDDHSLKLLGELLSNQVSRDIIRLLIEKEMYANEIASKLDIQFSLISHHLKKMEELGLLFINEKKIIKKGQLHKYYKINPGIFVLPNYTKDRIEEKGLLKKIFKDGVKFASIGIAAFVSWISIKSQSKTLPPSEDSPDYGSTRNYEDFFEIIISEPLIVPLLIIIVGLSILFVLEKKKKSLAL